MITILFVPGSPMIDDAIPRAGGIFHIQAHLGEKAKIADLAYIVDDVNHSLRRKMPAIAFEATGHSCAYRAVGEHLAFKALAAHVAYPCPTR